MLVVFGADFRVRMAGRRAEGDALRRGSGGCVGDGEHRDDGAEDDGKGARAVGADDGVALLVVGLHTNGREGQVGAVDGNHGGLREAGFRVGVLDGRVHGDEGYDEQNDEVDRDGALVHAAAAAGEEDVHDDGHGEGCGVHAQRRADEQEAPGAGVTDINLFQAVLCVGVCQVDEQDEAEEYEEHGSDEGHVSTPNLEKGLGDEEGQDHEGEPDDDLGAPEPVL